MCLYVREIPKNSTNGRIVKSFKEMYHTTNNTFITPYQAAAPLSGWLYAPIGARKGMWDSKKLILHSAIYEGVHSFQYNTRTSPSLYNNIFTSYAIGVAAYGHIDLVSALLYIPRLGNSVMNRLVYRLYDSWSKKDFENLISFMPKERKLRNVAKEVLKTWF